MSKGERSRAGNGSSGGEKTDIPGLNQMGFPNNLRKCELSRQVYLLSTITAVSVASYINEYHI